MHLINGVRDPATSFPLRTVVDDAGEPGDAQLHLDRAGGLGISIGGVDEDLRHRSSMMGRSGVVASSIRFVSGHLTAY